MYQLSENDKMSLELLTNHAKYKKFLSIVNPEKFNEEQKKTEKYDNLYKEINEITTELLENPEKTISQELNESFDHYIQCCIRHIELKNLENKYEDDNTMFSNMVENPSTSISSSYWGKKLIKKS